MVFGLGEGKMDLQIPKTSFARGETIQGKAILELNKPKKAKRLVVILTATREERRTTINSRGQRMQSNRTITLYSNEAVLGEEQEYPSGKREYEFSIQAPNQGFEANARQPEGALGAIAGVAQTLGMGTTISPVKWVLTAKLDLPLSFDISKAVQISIA